MIYQSKETSFKLIFYFMESYINNNELVIFRNFPILRIQSFSELFCFFKILASELEPKKKKDLTSICLMGSQYIEWFEASDVELALLNDWDKSLPALQIHFIFDIQKEIF